MAEEKKDNQQGGWIENEFVCAHCLTDEDMKALEHVLDDEEMKEAKKQVCTRCGKEH